MAIINHAKREINAKIVYYGREGAGKRSSLQYIYDRIKPSLRGDLKSPSASGDSLFFFDFSPFEKPMFLDYRIRFHVYTLPGKVVNPASWKMTLKGADGLVIVADASPEISTAERENISLLRGFLAAYGVGLHDIPCVLQLNKGSSPYNMTAAGMAEVLDLPNIQVCLSEPSSGEGVLTTLSLLSREILTRIGQDESLRLIESEVMQANGNDAEVSAAILSLDKSTDGPVEVSHLVEAEKTALTAIEHEDGANQLQVKLAVEGATCKDGVVRVPLEFMHAGSMSRLVVSIAIDPV
jgi:signal recognition particle receptor subunit beta